MSARLLLAVAACAAALTHAAPARAQESLVSDRPDFTESALIAQSLQLEAGITYTAQNGASGWTFGEALVRLPVTRRFELRLGLGSHVAAEADGADHSGWAGASAGFKVAIGEGGGAGSPIPTTAFLLNAPLPIGERAFRPSAIEPEAILAASWELSPALGLGANLGYALEQTSVLASASLGVGLGPRTAAYAELYGTPEEDGSPRPYADAGVTLLLTPDLQLDARAGLAVEQPRERFVGFGIALRR